ncbi:MAG: sigma-54 dependent transcriptional regulator [Desulfobulbaceae bacterium]|nr:sigma-54 dependent transcriptional regulator [Desulfobulbaceae bacterium]
MLTTTQPLKILNTIAGVPSEIINKISTVHLIDSVSPDDDITHLVSTRGYHLVFVDGGVDNISRLLSIDPRLKVLFFGRDEMLSISAITYGAFAYLIAPPFDYASIEKIIDNIGKDFSLRSQVSALENSLLPKYIFAGLLIGKNPEMLDIFDLVSGIAPYYTSVLITGESGTGKELLAKALHALSPVCDAPFLTCNISGHSEQILHSELFGHIGGDRQATKGLFQLVEHGNLFLDEIGELSPSLQTVILQILQEGHYRPLGSSHTVKTKCRIIAATNKDLAAEVNIGKFRQDLYYTLTPLMIRLPPLRNRKDDIPLLSRFFISNFVQRTGKRIHGISRPAQQVLMSYDWPGNIRELEHILEQAMVTTDDNYIHPENLPFSLFKHHEKREQTFPSLHTAIISHIRRALHICANDLDETAHLLQISQSALHHMLEKYSIKL